MVDFLVSKLTQRNVPYYDLGRGKTLMARFYTKRKLFWSDGPIKILGIWVSPNQIECYHYNYIDVLDKVHNICNAWENRNMTLFGKITIVNTLITSLFNHKFMALPSPPMTFFKIFKRLITQFIWNNKIPKIAYTRLLQKYERLGLKLIDLETRDKALKIAWLAKWADVENTDWKYINLPFPDARSWYCNLNSTHSLEKIQEETLSTMQHIWKCWMSYSYRKIEEVSQLEDILENADLG